MSTHRWITALAIICLGTVCAASRAEAQPVEKGALGVGIILGEPTGVSAKLYLADDTAIAAAAGFAFIEGGLHVHADYLWHPWVLEDAEHFVLPAYIGAGLRALNEDRGGGSSAFHMGLRGVAGMLFDFKEVPLDVFVEVAGLFDYAFTNDDGGIGFGINAALGARYYF
ncbi:hypothetical protein [Haliangium sp.]|uniref:hypothetical protein n=1 Tax=Haliangium sp. TaxID=2663208 RepID=UPI003D0A8F21